MSAVVGWDPRVLPLLAQQLATGRCVRLAITTTSMAPFLLPGDWVVLAAAAGPSLRAGDIVAVTARPHFLVHRVVAVAGTPPALLLTTKGDAGTARDRPLPPEALLGRVVAVERAGACLALTTPQARFVARLLAAISCARVGAAHLAPRFLRLSTHCMLRLVQRAVVGLAWRTQRPAARRAVRPEGLRP